MRRHLAAPALGVALLLAGTACGGPDDAPDTDVVGACNGYNQLLNEWSTGYGAEMGAVGQASAAGDEARQETAVPVVRELFVTIAEGLREQAGATSHEELADALNQAADGLVEISEQIDSYEDVTAAPEMMSRGAFAEGGERVGDICGPADSA